MKDLIVTADVVLVARGTKDGKNEVLYNIGLAQNGNVGTFFVTKEIYESVEGYLYKNLTATFQYIESQQYGNRLRLTNIEMPTPEFEPIPFMEHEEASSQPEGKPVTKNDKHK